MSITTTHQSTESGFAPVVVTSRDVPLLENGDKLTRDEFERRYAAMPEVKKAELIEGIVYMPSPVRLYYHARSHGHLMTWVGYYESKTPHIISGDNGTSRLDKKNEPQPDVMLFLPKWAGGTAEVDDAGYVAGAPDLVCEVAASSVSIDLHDKLNAYQRNGVKEYLVWRVEEGVIDWFELVSGKFVPMSANESGILRSKVFPGLWLDMAGLLTGNLAKIFAIVELGTSTAEHEAFCPASVGTGIFLRGR